MTEYVTSRPAKVQWAILAGDAPTLTVTFTDSGGAVDMSSFTFEAKVLDQALVEQVTITVNDDDAATGVIVLSLTGVQTAALERGYWYLRDTVSDWTLIDGPFVVAALGQGGVGSPASAASVVFTDQALTVTFSTAVTVEGEGGASVSDTAYGVSWNGVTAVAPSKNAVYDKIETLQPLDSDLTAVAALSPTNDDVLQRKAGAWSNRTIAQLLSDLAAAGTTFQPLDSDLTSIAALTTTSFGRSLLEAANAAALRTLADSPSNAEAVLDSLFDAHTILAATSDNTPAALTVGEQTLVGRITSGNIAALTASQVRTLLGLVIGTNVQAWDADLDVLAAGKVTVEDVTGTSYTVDGDDAGKVLRATNASLCTFSLADGVAVGTIVELLAWGAAGIAVQDNGTSTVQVEGSVAQYGAVSCVVVATNTWSVVGAIS